MSASAGVCRICLSVDAALTNIADTPLQSIYERLTTLTLHTADGRPLEVCCICRAQLIKSFKLMLKALKAEAILSAILDRSVQVTQQSVSMIDRQALGLCGELTSSSAECFDNILPERVEIKPEPLVEDADNTVMEYEQLEEPPQPQPAAAINILLKEERDADGDNKFFIDIRPITVVRDTEMNSTGEEDIGNDGEPEEPSGVADENPFQCYICQQRFKNESHLKSHKRIHRGKKPECRICKQTFTRPESLKRHLRTHTGEKPYECNICQRRFSAKNNLLVHHRRHTGEKFICNVCNRKYSEKRTLKLHLKSHIAVKPHQCSVCLHLFEQSSQLESHMKTHTAASARERDFSHQRLEQNHRSKTELRTREKHECPICKKTLTRKTSLKTHLRTHTGEKPYECAVCRRRFADKNNLLVHTRCHTLDKPFECYICNHKFYQKSNLNTHLRTHTGEAPYECNVCQRKFNQSSNLHTHYAKCHSGP